MARVRITEYRAKKLLLGTSYRGVAIEPAGKNKLPKGRLVVKVDQGVKKRFQKGLVALDVSEKTAKQLLQKWAKRGFSRFLVEPYFSHNKNAERYISIERVRGGLQVLYANSGGVDVETSGDKIEKYTLTKAEDIAACIKKTKIPASFLNNLLNVFEANYFSFLEINPFISTTKGIRVLDAAAQVDSAAANLVAGAWSEADIVEGQKKFAVEERVDTLAKTTPASLKLTVINPNGSLFFLLSGGGGSIVIADEAKLQGVGGLIANYGEYSGGPSREETRLYTREIISLLLKSKSKKKALVIAGGIANFTDIKETFLGITDALDEKVEELRKAKAQVFVRRGGPNETEGLRFMKDYLSTNGLLGEVRGSSSPIVTAAQMAIRFLKP